MDGTDRNDSAGSALREEEAVSLAEMENRWMSDIEKINFTLDRVDWFVRRKYLSVLDQAQVVPLDSQLSRIVPGSNMRLAKIHSLLFEDTDRIAETIRNIYGSIDGYGESAVLILEGKHDRVNLYLGVCSQRENDVNYVYRTFRSALGSVLPGSECRNISGNSMEKVIREILPEDEEIHISAVSGVLEPADSKRKMSGKLDVLIDGMRRKPFTMILLAKAMERNELALIRQGYEQMYTEISPFQKQDLSLSQSTNESFGVTFSNTMSNSMSISSGVSHGYSVTEGSSHGTQTGPDNSDLQKRQAVMGIASALGSAALTMGTAAAGEKLLQSLFYSSSVSNLLGNIDKTIRTPRQNHTSTNESHHEERSRNYARQENETNTESSSHTDGVTQSTAKTEGKSVQMTYINKSVSNLLGLLDEQIKNLTVLEGGGAFRFAAYFIAGDRASAISVANMYRSITASESRYSMKSPIYHWEQEKAKAVGQYLMRGFHPIFAFAPETGLPEVTVAQPVALKELPSYLSLPERSVPGLVITNHAPFARDVIYQNGSSGIIEEDRKIDIGCVYYLGKEDKRTAVSLNMDDLTKHLFVTGCTGVGKSNFCYQLLDKLAKKRIKILIIEPAKGEYAKVFGGREDFHVYGTNIKKAPLLKINPFAFPEGIHVLEHIERLLDIFNAAWPMYSAMPAVLKDSIERIYVKRGFDMVLGDKPQNEDFPCFADLLEEIPLVLKISEYSGEVKGNYIGALVTRVKSLTNGIYSFVFGQEEIGDSILFDENVIADISRIGSEETKALLMGVLVMRLSEYRMSQGRMNSGLLHVTLLEEAHHLLKRQTMSSSENGNMRAASVEMITNAIAEMRTNGEGFIIADQSPSVMDLSVIRNTQTKAVFMLPDREDQKIAGSALALNEARQQEIAKLIPGVAVMHQNGWSEAVLCKVDYFEETKMNPYVYEAPVYFPVDSWYTGQCVSVLLKTRLKKGKRSSLNEDLIYQFLKQDQQLCSGKRKDIYKVLRDFRVDKTYQTKLQTLSCLLEKLLDLKEIFALNARTMDIAAWERGVRKGILKRAALTEDETDLVISVVIRAMLPENPKARRLYVRHLMYCDEANRKMKMEYAG